MDAGASVSRNPVQDAIKRGDTASLLRLIRTQPQLINEYGNTALIFGAWKGYEDIVRALIIAKTDLNKQDKKGQKAIDMVCSFFPDDKSEKSTIENLIRNASPLSLSQTTLATATEDD
eukprot:gene12276-25804_t